MYRVNMAAKKIADGERLINELHNDYGISMEDLVTKVERRKDNLNADLI